MVTIEIKRAIKCGNDLGLFITFPFNQDIVNVMRSLPIRYWHNDNKCWEAPFKYLGSILEDLADFEIEIKADDAAIFQTKKEMPVDYKFKTNPFQHQIDGFNYGLSHDRWLLGDEQGLGKALALNTKVYTPNGYKLMSAICEGDLVIGKNGKPTKVTAVYNHTNVEMYKITFSDGVSIECCKDHLWEIYDQHGKKVVDTKWLFERNVLSIGGSYKYWIDRCDPVQFSCHPVTVHPYVLGALLGDGSLTSNSIGFTTADEEMVTKVNANLREGYVLNSSKSMNKIDYNIIGKKGKRNEIKQNLIELGLWNTNSHTKFIPEVYKYNTVDVRTQVLQGLIDTDGYVTKDNLMQYTTVSKQLCEDVRFLVESLGGIVTYHEKPCKHANKVTGISYTLTIRFDEPQLYCSLTRKRNLLHSRRFKARRNIVSIEKINNADAKCITVDNIDGLYLIDHFVVTHNTKQVIDIAVAKKQQRGYSHCLIVCGVNGLKWNWVNEIATHSNETAYVLGQRVQKGGRVVVKSSEDKLEDAKNLANIDSYFIITNIETLRYKEWTGEYINTRNGKKKKYVYPIADELRNCCNNGTIGMIAADEVHKMKNPDSDQGTQFLKLTADTMIAMTGTPLMNSPLDLYIILKWLGYEDHSYYAFKNHYCEMGGYGNYQIVGYKHLDVLQNQLNEFMLRRLKNDVLDLPEKTLINEYVEMTPKQAKIYKEVRESLLEDIDRIKASTNPLAEMLRLRQATGCTGILSTTINESAKLDRMEEIIEDAVANGKKVVVFSNWTQMTDAVIDRLKDKYSLGVITGETKDAERQGIVMKFQDTPINASMHDRKYDGIDVLIGTIGAMGTGLTLTAGTVEIFMDEPWTMAAKNQAIDRCHRIGQNSNITVYTLLTKNTIDERINAIVEEKGEMSDMLVDGKPVDNRALVDYLLS